MGASSTFDPESGRTPSAAGIVRNVLSRRSRFVWGSLLLGGLVFYVLESRGSHRHHPPHHENGGGHGPGMYLGDEHMHGSIGAGMTDLEDDLEEYAGDDEGGGGWSDGLGVFVVDEFGDHYYPDYHGDHHIPDFDPDMSLLPPPSNLFPEVDLRTYLQPAQPRVFPDSHMRAIVSPEEPPADGEVQQKPLIADPYITAWKAPKDWRGVRREVKKIQWHGFDDGTAWETKAEKAERRERAEAVKRGFAYAWQEYKDHAWGEQAAVLPRVAALTTDRSR